MARAPFSRYGGKWYLLPELLPLIPPHHASVELFCGAAWLTLAKSPAPLEVINDLDDGVAGFYRVLRDPLQSARLQALLELTPYSRSEFNACRAVWESESDPVERARAWFVLARQSFAGRLGWSGWSYSATHSASGMASTTSKWLGAIEGLPEVHARLRTVQIECADWRNVLSAYDRADTFIYADPPYVLGTRRERRRGYVHELSDDDHGDLVGALLGCRSRVLLSAYDHAIYAPLAEAGWHRAEIAVSCHAAGRTRATRILGEGAARRLQPRTEIVWTNYDPRRLWGQTSLFDHAQHTEVS